MSKYLLVSALLIFLVFRSNSQTGSTIIAGGYNDLKITSVSGDNENEFPADSTDALTVFSAKIKDKTVYLNWRILNPKEVSYYEILRLDPKKKEYKKVSEGKIKVDDQFEKSEGNDGRLTYMYDYEDSPERDGVYYYKLAAYNSNSAKLFESDEIKIGITGIRNFKIEQNTPNPFNPTTNISYELFDASYVKLKVFDLIGKEIATLVDGNQTKGTYTVTFDASKYANLTSGIYFYKLETEKYSEVKKMILTK